MAISVHGFRSKDDADRRFPTGRRIFLIGRRQKSGGTPAAAAPRPFPRFARLCYDGRH
jgi:hypothetical protein